MADMIIRQAAPKGPEEMPAQEPLGTVGPELIEADGGQLTLFEQKVGVGRKEATKNGRV